MATTAQIGAKSKGGNNNGLYQDSNRFRRYAQLEPDNLRSIK